MAAWLKDQRGSTLIQFILLLPAFLVVVLGAVEVWKVLAVKQSLHAGTYQATRYLTLYNEPGSNAETDAFNLIRTALLNNGLVADAVQRGEALNLRVVYYDRFGRQVEPGPTILDCDEPFTVRATLSMPWMTIVPWLSSIRVTIGDEHNGHVECGR
jgi:Flp pilus assembly protein TadG